MDRNEWAVRFKERTDISTNLVHLTRKTDDKSSLEVLLKILGDKKLIGSTTKSGFIVGKRKAVCFQDAPLQGIVHNVYYEEKKKQNDKKYNVKYSACGLMFKKTYVYKKGGRPVIYDKTSEAKSYLDKDNYWRIVNLNLDKDDELIDWTHEREWRCPDDFEFDLSKTAVLTPNTKIYKKLIKEYEILYGNSIFEDVNSVVNLGITFI